MYPVLIALAATLGDKIDSAFYGFDVAIYKIFGAMQNGFFTAISKVFTSFGDENFVIPLAVLGVILCLFKKTRKYGFALVFAIAIGTLVTNVVVKPMVLRIRPYNTLQNAPIWGEYKAIIKKHDDRGADAVGEIERFAFYEEAKKAYAIVATGETAIYANIMLQKGVVIPE